MPILRYSRKSIAGRRTEASLRGLVVIKWDMFDTKSIKRRNVIAMCGVLGGKIILYIIYFIVYFAPAGKRTWSAII